MDEVKIELCPFCGGEADFMDSYTTVWIQCTECGARSCSYPKDTVAGKNGYEWALYRWNMRAKK